MSRIAYVNGRYIRHAEAGVSIDDRAFLFADGIYEVIEIFDGALIDEAGHLAGSRARRGNCGWPLPVGEARAEVDVARTGRAQSGHGSAMSICRSRAARRGAIMSFPTPGTPATLVAFAHRADRAAAEAKAQAGVKVISLPDIRWKRPDIKTTSLLPNVLAKQQAREAGAYEAWLVDGRAMSPRARRATPGSSSRGRSRHPSRRFGDSRGNHPRAAVRDRRSAGPPRRSSAPFTVDETKTAREAFITGATTLVMPVVAIDGRKIGSGAPGPVALWPRAAFHDSRPRTA